jgi:hypothetical protein
MLPFAWHRLAERPALWLLAAACAVIVAVPGAIAATHLAAPLTALVLTGDLGLALALLPAAFSGAAAPVAWAAAAVAALLGLCAWSRLFAAAVWASAGDDDRLRVAWQATRGEWRAVALLYLQAYLVIGALTVALLGLLAGAGPLFTTGGLVAVGAAALARAAIRVAATVAIRAAVLDGYRVAPSWRRALEILEDRRTDAAAVWLALVAVGAAVWMGGRLISPVLQDTAFQYPATSGFAVTRQGAQVVLAVPLEGFLIGLSLAAWTALYMGVERAPEAAPRTQRLVPRALAVVVGLTVVANGIPTIVDASWSRQQRDMEQEIAAREISLEHVLRSQARAPRSSTAYDVRATIDGRELTWTTRIALTNETSAALRTIGLHVYPAAYARDLRDIPLARELLQSDYAGTVRATVRPGDVQIEHVSVNGRAADFSLDDTALSVDLRRPLERNDSVRLEVAISGELPIFPERYGTWDGMTLLGNWIPTVARRRDGRWILDRFGEVGDPFFSGVADYRVAIEADDHQWVIGTGVLSKIEQSATDRRTWHFEASSARDAAFAVAPFMGALEQNVAGITVRSWYPAEDRLTGAANLNAATSAIRAYSEMFGALPFDEVDVVATNGRLGGMEYPGVVFIGRSAGSLEGLPVLPDLLRYAGFSDAQRRYVLGHELAHQWWYAAVGNDGVREPWLDEAFAEVSTILWLRGVEHEDRTWAMTNLSADMPESASDAFASVHDFSSNEEYISAVYSSGAATLLELRALIGPERFEDIMRTYYEQNVGEVATIDEFIGIVREIGGPEAAALLAR